MGCQGSPRPSPLTTQDNAVASIPHIQHGKILFKNIKQIVKYCDSQIMLLLWSGPSFLDHLSLLLPAQKNPVNLERLLPHLCVQCQPDQQHFHYYWGPVMRQSTLYWMF